MTSHKKSGNCCKRHTRVTTYHGGVRGGVYTSNRPKKSRSGGLHPSIKLGGS